MRSITASFREQLGTKVWMAVPVLWRFFRDYIQYCSIETNLKFRTSWRLFSPHFTDNLKVTPLEPIYFYQDCWGVEKICQIKPMRHVDVGSSVKTMAILSRWVPVTFLDIRRPDLTLEGLDCREGNILELPFPSESLDCVSSLCVVEHIGLGRYGDALDPFGSEKAIAELKRVVRPGGHLIFSVPVDDANQVCFNAHRTFTRDAVLGLMAGFTLKEEKYIYGRMLTDSYQSASGFGTGLYHFQKSVQ
jgi:SAM-dependent methyltransferase